MRLTVTTLFSKYHQSIVIAMPITVLVLLVLATSVNMPFWDEWELVPIFQHLHAGHFYFQDFWQQHNEHRIFFPTLVLVGLAFVTRWNTQVENIVSLLVAIGSFVLIHKALRLQERADRRVPVIVALLISVLWFSPGQIENWLWGWQLEWYMNVFGIALVVYGLVRARVGILTKKVLVLIVCGAFLSEFSLGNGMLIWPLIILALLLFRTSLTRLAMVAGIGCVATALYFVRYSDLASSSSRLALQQPVQYIKYVLIYMGRPLSYMHGPALLFGAVSLGLFFGFCGYLLLYRKELFRQAIPWIALGLYALGTASTTGLGRLGFGVDEALSSRYTTISSLFFVSALMVVWIARNEFKRFLGSLFIPLKICATLVFLGLLLINFSWGVHAAIGQHRTLRALRACTSMPDPTDTCLLTSYPDAGTVRSRLEYIKSLEWGGY